MRRALKSVGWLLLGLVTLAFLWFALAFTLSRFDDAPAPDVQAALAEVARPVDSSEANGFVWLLGLDAPAGVRPVDAARARLQQGAHAAPSGTSPVTELAQTQFEALRCKYDLPGVSCVAWYGARAAQLDALLPAFALVDQRYAQMLLAPAYDEAVPTEPFGLLAYTPVSPASERHIARLMLQAQRGAPEAALKGLADKLAFERRMLIGSRTLIGKMVAQHLLQRSQAAIADLVQAHPQLAASVLNAAVNTPLRAAELSLRGPLAFELVSAQQLIETARSPQGLTEVQSAWSAWVVRWFMRPNQTLNAFARHYAAVNDACDAAAGGAPEALQTLQTPRPPWSWWRVLRWPSNVAGELLLEMALPDVAGYCVRLLETEALRRMVLAQATLALKPTEALPAALGDPITGRPFERTASGELRFVYVSRPGSLPTDLRVRLPQAAK
jgi:hypothetical protein